MVKLLKLLLCGVGLSLLVTVVALPSQPETGQANDQERQQRGGQGKEREVEDDGITTTLMGWASDALSGVIIGLATSAVWAGMIWHYNRRRNKNLEREICDSMKPEGFSFHADRSVGLSVENPTDYPVVVRSVVIRGGEGEQSTVDMGLHEGSSPPGTHGDERGWVELPPHTKATWAVSFQKDPTFSEVSSMFLPFTSIVITIEYKTLLGKTKIVEIQPARFHQRNMLDAFEKAAEGKLMPPGGAAGVQKQ